jgi:hypothetical protein
MLIYLEWIIQFESSIGGLRNERRVMKEILGMRWEDLKANVFLLDAHLVEI